MKKINNLLIFIFLLGICYNVKADMGPPVVAQFEIIVSNKDGAYCYSANENGYLKSDRFIPFGEIYKVTMDIDNKYIHAYSDGEECIFKASDVSIKTDSFSIDNDGVTKINEVKGVILATSGLNMRKGPSTKYSIITTIPVGKIITLKYTAGTFWYYAEYNGKGGWISGRDQTFAYDGSYVLYSYNDIDIFDSNDKVIGKIPKFTEITDYVCLIDYLGPSYYVNYNGIKGYIYSVSYKVDGELKLKKDANLYDTNDQIIKKIAKETTLKYSIYIFGMYGDDYDNIYIPTENGFLHLYSDDIYGELGYEEKNILKKTSGFIGEGLYGEIKINNTKEEPIKKQDIESKNNNYGKLINLSNRELILVCIFMSIILALTAVIIILLILNSKKKNKITVENKQNNKEDSN